MLQSLYRKDRPKPGILRRDPWISNFVNWYWSGNQPYVSSKQNRSESLANPDQTVLAYVKTPTKDNPDAISQISKFYYPYCPSKYPIQTLNRKLPKVRANRARESTSN